MVAYISQAWRHVRARFYRWALRGLLAGLLITVLGGIAVFAWPMDAEAYLHAPASGELMDRAGRPMYAYLNPAQQWCFVRELDAISPWLVKATLAAEDQRFYSHPGVDPIAVLRAFVQNVRGRRIASGASTLTMQAVKIAQPAPRGWWSKVRQAINALRLERHASKNRILQAYLNGAPYGMNLVGCEAAAQRYFGRPARELTLPEAALLAGLPKAPTNYMPLEHRERAMERRSQVLERMRAEGFITEAECAEARQAPLGAQWHDFPALSPHLAMRLAPEAARQGGPLATTLDAGIQAMAERLVSRATKGYDGEITNAAAIVIDTDTADVLARAGSANFYNTPGGGQVDATHAPRSPGSTLKPFTYALAMERNCLYPEESLYDGSLDYGMYNPLNYDGQYRGLIPASFALRRSLNVPAVTVLDRVGESEAYAFLQNIGLTTLHYSPEHYGLGLTLGSCEAYLDELAAAYAMLARLGEYRPLRQLASDPEGPSKRVLSRGVCLSLYEMLNQELPGEPAQELVRGGGVLPRVCWKTGTSTGHHDAWAFAYNQQYVVGVWMGNNDGKSSKWLAGARSALPLARRIFRSLPPRSTPYWPEAGNDWREIEVCAVSGLPSTPWCRHTRTAHIPSSQYSTRRCDVHYPAPDAPGGVLERWPGSARSWDLARIDAPVTMDARDGANNAARAEALRILEPSDQSEFVLTGEPRGDTVRLRTSLDAQSNVYWYLDDTYLGVSTADKPLMLPLSEGEHKLTCMAGADSAVPSGATHTVQFRVESPSGAPSFRP